MKKIQYLLFTVCMVLCLCGCGTPSHNMGSADISSGSAPDNSVDLTVLDMPYIGVILKSTNNPYFALMKAGIEDEADALGVQVMVVSPESETSADAQADLLDTMSNMAVDVIAIAPSNEDILLDGLKNAYKNDKIIMAIDSSLSFEGCSCYIGTDHYTAAYREGKYAAELIQETENVNAVILRGAKNDKTHTLREYGLTDGLHDGGAHVLDAEICNSSDAEAEKATNELLKIYGNIDAICTTNDAMAIGAQRAVAEAGRKDIHIVSFDGMQDASELVRVGEIDADFAQDAYTIGTLCVDNAVKLYHGETVEKSIHTDIECITASNAEQHIEEIMRRLNHQARK